MDTKTHRQSNNALIIFTREPVAGHTKTRLMPYLSGEQCADLHLCFLHDIVKEAVKTDADICVSYTGGEPQELRRVFGENAAYREQIGDDLGAKMLNAIRAVIDSGYSKVVLIGTDIPEICTESICKAFDALDRSDVVIGPTEDGGYYLIGMKKTHEGAFKVRKYGSGTVLDDTVKSIREDGLTVSFADAYMDIDTREDIQSYCRRMRLDERLQNTETGKFLAENIPISVIIPTYNESASIINMMDQLEEYRNQAEIIFVDGGSSDDTVEKIGDRYTVIRSGKGRAVQMNTAAEKCCGDIIFFLHCDSKLPESAIAEVRRCMTSNAYGCFGVRFESRNFFMWTNRIISNHRAWKRGLPFGDQGIFIDRKLFFEVGMFPELPIMEDYEFGRRLVACGIKPGKTAEPITTSSRRYGKGTIGILKTEYKMWNLRRLYRKGLSIDEISEMYRDIR